METIAPPVVAVIVTCNPGEWFEETLRAFAAQDYPELSILVLDAASDVDPTPAWRMCFLGLLFDGCRPTGASGPPPTRP